MLTASEGGKSYLALDKTSVKCEECSERNHYTWKFMVAYPAFESYMVEVVKLENQYDEERKEYKIRAVVKCTCSSCEVPLEGIADVTNIPVEIVRKAFGKCRECGSNLVMKSNSITQSSIDYMTDSLDFRAELLCENCQQAIPFRKKMKLALKPAWNRIKNIKKLKIGKDRVELEMDTDK